jgi:hypothetical protein
MHDEVDKIADLPSAKPFDVRTYATVTGATIVDTRSMNTTKRIEKQQNPQS